MRIMISKFNTVFLQPEDVVIEQLDLGDTSMYLIADGACQVKIIDQKKNIRLGKLLRAGDYFGEISLIYVGVTLIGKSPYFFGFKPVNNLFTHPIISPHSPHSTHSRESTQLVLQRSKRIYIYLLVKVGPKR